MSFLTALLSSTTVPFSPNVAFNNSWLTVKNGEGVPFFAQGHINIPISYDFDIITDTNVHYNNYSKIVTIGSTIFSNLTGNYKSIVGVSGATFPSNFTIESSIQGFSLSSGSVIAYK